MVDADAQCKGALKVGFHISLHNVFFWGGESTTLPVVSCEWTLIYSRANKTSKAQLKQPKLVFYEEFPLKLWLWWIQLFTHKTLVTMDSAVLRKALVTMDSAVLRKVLLFTQSWVVDKQYLYTIFDKKQGDKFSEPWMSNCPWNSVIQKFYRTVSV